VIPASGLEALSVLAERELVACGVEPGATVAVLTQGSARATYAEAFRTAALRIDAFTFTIDLPDDGLVRGAGELGVRAAETGLGGFCPSAVAACRDSDLVVDLVFLLWSREKEEILAGGSRILTCIEPLDVLARLAPTSLQRTRALACRERLERATRLRVTSPAGTDLVYELGQYGYIHQYGIADQPGRWDHFASSLVGTVARDGGVNGQLVFQPGDILFPYKRYFEGPVRVVVEAGTIVQVEGGTDALLMREYVESFGDERGWAISHIGWGLNENARWDALLTGSGGGIGMDSRSFLGSVMFSTGPNAEFGGTNDTPCHMDMPLRGCSLWLDDELVIDDGQLASYLLDPVTADLAEEATSHEA